MKNYWKPKPTPATKPFVIPPVTDLPADSAYRDVRLIRVWPDYPMDRLDTMKLMARSIASRYGVRIFYSEVIDLERPDWIDFTDENMPAVREFCKGVIAHTILHVRQIYIHRPPADGILVGGLGEGKVSIVSATACRFNAYLHEWGHAAMGADAHRETPNNIMNTSGCRAEDVEFEPDQAAAFVAWARCAYRLPEA